MSGVGLAMRRELQQDLSKLINEEASIDAELRQYFSALSSGRSLHSNKSFDSADLSTSIKKIERFAPCFEAMVEDSKKLATQVEDCRSLSDRLSVLVRRLDIMQIHAQQALACTEDIINLKDWKQKMSAAMDEGNLPLAVSFIRQVHDIEVQAARASDDFGAIQQAEREVRQTVQKEFATAIEESNIPRVMALCPLLQTLGLEVEARDVFLSFVEKNVFTAVSADASAVDGTTDAATGYAQALSSVFNSSYLILQQYLPMVIQGMENSLGDIYFIRKLHAKCEVESGLVLKRYMKFRHIKNTFVTMKVGSSAPSLKQQPQVTPAEIHVILDELALLIQYCCMYSKYLKQLCDGAQSRKRAAVVTESTEGKAVQSPPLTGHITVFNGPTDFDKMVDELINRYYMEGEHWLMRLGVKNAFLRGRDHEDGSSLDECFFVLQRCGQRAVATNNIHAACAVLHLISDLLSSDLLSQLSDAMTSASIKAAPVLQEHLARFTRSGNTDGVDSSGSASLSKGLQSAISLASSLANSAAVTGGAGADDAEEGLTVEDEDDPYGLSGILDSFNVAEVCIRYTERLMRDVSVSGENVFGAAAGAGAGAGAEASQQSTGASSSHIHGRQLLSPDMEKLKVSRENFEAAKLAFQQVFKELYYLLHRDTLKFNGLSLSSFSSGSSPGHRKSVSRRSINNERCPRDDSGSQWSTGRRALRPVGREVRRPAGAEPAAEGAPHALRAAADHVHQQSERGEQGNHGRDARRRLLREARTLHLTGELLCADVNVHLFS
jgi:hypothetical protein